ncbi:histidine kinase [Sorangium cellulosum]|uniref:histidine kinase n=1 Tax=Sorangium cellulosum TaxID=56 RepID=A0A4P2Q2N6_SORCE|nr:hybrid sensor histidine kinase/response regulator [Sorangium cellulosum]AUX23228.1 histidine kinase [Sorangium cellulosum]
MTRAASEQRTLLIVDDERETLKALRRELRRDYEVLAAESAEQGYAILRERRVQVVLSDQRMPGMTGTAFHARVKADYPDTVRLLMTAYADTSAAIQAINEGGVYRFIAKPWDPDALAAVIRDAFCQHDRLWESRRLLGSLRAKAEGLERENQELIGLNQTIQEFVGIAAHDLRNPIAAIQWLATMLLKSAGDPRKDPRGHLQKIQSNAGFTLQLLEDLLDITMLEHGDVALREQDAELRSLIAAAVSLNEHSARQKGIAVVVDVPAGIPQVRCDVERIEQVLSNLLSNAFKFSHPGTTVTVSARAAEGAALVTVQDQGLGIRPEEISDLFCKFRRTSTRSTGGEKSTGLGLSICKALVERHGGAIRVESELGRGTRVLFTLPLSAR